MNEFLMKSELFEGLDERAVSRLGDVARSRSLHKGEYLFLLGDDADRLYVVSSGRLDICFPLVFRGTMKDITVEARLPGHSLGWSAFVKPHRFTMSARAAEASEVVYFLRRELLEIFEDDPSIGMEFSQQLAEVIGTRLLKMQALWARELQRAIADGMAGLVINQSAEQVAAGAASPSLAHEPTNVRTRGTVS